MDPRENLYVQNREYMINFKQDANHIDRRIKSRGDDIKIVIGGALAAALTEGLNQLSIFFTGSPALRSWSLKVLVATPIILLIVELVRRLLWRDDDRIFESEKQRKN